ncbi:hypothetical protein DFH06DRAFT_1129202 [Mycena polygramma]|nr:hypothetical protein DFH06DRAFT_1129202 [Mycena polygramma]
MSSSTVVIASKSDRGSNSNLRKELDRGRPLIRRLSLGVSFGFGLNASVARRNAESNLPLAAHQDQSAFEARSRSGVWFWFCRYGAFEARLLLNQYIPEVVMEKVAAYLKDVGAGKRILD